MVLRTQKSLRQAINEKVKTITDEEIFESSSYKEFLNAMISGVTKRFGQPVQLDIVSEDENSTAYTDGNRIHINYNFKLINNLERKDKNTSIIASVLHECAHILFSDFRLYEAVQNKLVKENLLYPQPNNNKKLLEDFTLWIQTNQAGSTLLPIYQFLCNSIEDGYVDKRIISCIPGYGQSRIWYKQKIMSAEIKSYEEMKNEKIDKITILLNLILGYSKYGVFLYDKDKSGNDELIKTFYEVKLLVDEAITKNNSIERYRKINEAFLHLYSIISNEISNQQNSQTKDNVSGQPAGNASQQSDSDDSQAGSRNSQNTQQNTCGTSEANSEQGMQNLSSSGENSKQSPQGNNSSTMDKKQIENMIKSLSSTLEKGKDDNHKNTQTLISQKISDSNGSDTTNNQPSEKDQDNKELNGNNTSESKTSETLLNQIVRQASEENIAKAQEKEIEKELSQQLKMISKDNGYHNNVNSDLKRAEISNEAETLYNNLHKDLDNIAKRLVKNLEKNIKDRQIGDTQNGLYMGKRLDNRSLYRKDKKIFTKKILPENIPDMEVSLLIDESGSMRGERIDTSMKAAYILYSFCDMLKIPVSVYGHRATGKVNLTAYTDGASLDNKDKIRIFGMNAGGCNRDGYALRFCLNKLKESDAAIKLMFIISDGRPNASGYGIQEGKSDIQEAVAEAKKNGIHTIAAAIGDDRESIKYIYTSGISEKKAALYLDISDLERLPKTFPQLIRKYLE